MDKIEKIFDELGSLVYNNFKPASMDNIGTYRVQRIYDNSIDAISYSVKYENSEKLIALVVSFIATDSDISAFWEPRDTEEFVLRVSTDEKDIIREITTSIYQLNAKGDKLFRDFADIVSDCEKRFKVIDLKPMTIRQFVSNIVEKVSGDKTNLSDKIMLLSSKQLGFKMLYNHDEYGIEIYFDSKCGAAALSEPKEYSGACVEFVVRSLGKKKSKSNNQVQLTVCQIMELDEATIKSIIDLF